jgi:hypothetical protein
MAEDMDQSFGGSFDYEADIAPLRGQFFQAAANTGLPMAEQAKLVRGSMERLERDKMRSLEMQRTAMQFEATKLQLEQARRSFADQQRGMAALSDLQKQLEFAVRNVPAGERNQAIGIIGINNAEVLATNPIAKSMFDSAIKGARTTTTDTTRDATVKSLLGKIDKAAVAKDYAGRPLNEFADEGSAYAVDTVIELLGSPEDKQLAADASPKDKLGIARKIRTEQYKSALSGGDSRPKTPSPRSLFLKPSPTYSP